MSDYTTKFTGKAGDYAQYRERYDPGVVLPMLREWCGLTPEWTVADIGAGTGMVGDLFRANGNRVIAVEPNAEMRAECEGLHAGDALFAVLDGRAENTGLADASVEMVTVGRALHWFDVEEAMLEFRRILKPRGWVTILAAGRAEAGREENTEYVKFLYTWAGRNTSIESCLRVYRQLAELFAGGVFHHVEVDGTMQVDWEGLRGLTGSFSHAPLAGSAEFAAFEEELRAYFERFQQDGRITWSSCTWISAGQFAE